MICPTCHDKGVIRVPWTDAPDDYALCLCAIGADIRRESSQGYALWQVWAAREQVHPARVYRLEEILTPAELSARGFRAPEAVPEATREAALLAAGKGRTR